VKIKGFKTGFSRFHKSLTGFSCETLKLKTAFFSFQYEKALAIIRAYSLLTVFTLTHLSADGECSSGDGFI
jgi:hypothetical protein